MNGVIVLGFRRLAFAGLVGSAILGGLSRADGLDQPQLDGTHDERGRNAAAGSGRLPLYAMYLNHVGFSVRAVADGQAAIDAAVELRPDVIVMDPSMP